MRASVACLFALSLLSGCKALGAATGLFVASARLAVVTAVAVDAIRQSAAAHGSPGVEATDASIAPPVENASADLVRRGDAAVCFEVRVEARTKEAAARDGFAFRLAGAPRTPLSDGEAHARAGRDHWDPIEWRVRAKGETFVGAGTVCFEPRVHDRALASDRPLDFTIVTASGKPEEMAWLYSFEGKAAVASK